MFTIEHLKFEHKAGTKDYDLYGISFQESGEEKKTLIIRRWGRKGGAGQVMCEEVSTPRIAGKQWDKLIKERHKKKYHVVTENQTNAATFEEISHYIGAPVFSRARAGINELVGELDSEATKKIADDLALKKQAEEDRIRREEQVRRDAEARAQEERNEAGWGTW
jgi:predicted DNA-binding WGR domain protein